MLRSVRFVVFLSLSMCSVMILETLNAQGLPPRYAMLELFTNTPCSSCGSQNPGLFQRLETYEGQYHLVSFYPGTPYQSCIFYQSNTSENIARRTFYPMIFGTPTVAINGIEFRSSSGVTHTVLSNVTGGESWLSVTVAETSGSTRDVSIMLQDHAGGSLGMGKLFAVIVEREIMYNAPNGETLHHNVFRRFLTGTNGDDVDLSSGSAHLTYQYDVSGSWNADEVYVVAWLTDTETKEVINSGTRFDPLVSGTHQIQRLPLRIYPNPAADIVNIDLPENSGATLRVFNTHGQLVLIQNAITGNTVSIDLTRWPVGIYQAEVAIAERIYRGSIQVVQ